MLEVQIFIPQYLGDNMPDVKCDHSATCREKDQCGGAKIHDDRDCDPCTLHKDAKCVIVMGCKIQSHVCCICGKTDCMHIVREMKER
jgi:hypothetical protein